ncbi:hypothetical protein NQ318_001989 [Aromia moschata]|uniref:Acetyl-CoA acetyltransferase n=1 Tax=Aromia moschata TaxID=1265417 RepID=A0AAV8Z2V0_9CUCU|nr:hypothetical protein NQ318_001989 [Aromia moschata]
MSEVFIISGCRTAIGNFQGQFDKFSAAELGAVAISEAVTRAQLSPQDVDQVVMGQVLTAGQGQNPARQAAVKSQIPFTSPAYTVNMMCGSGLKAVALGYQAIRSGDCNIVIGRGCRLGPLNLCDTLLTDGLTDVFNNVHMGNTALGEKYGISREAQDEYACRSQNKAEGAIKNNFFDKEIVGVPEKRTGKVLDKDEFPRFGTTVETLTKLRPCFDPSGSVTAGNASGINDGAAAVLLCSEQTVNKKGLKPMAKILGFAEVGVEPLCMGTGPIGAVLNVLKKVGWSKEEVDLYELNEAFAVQSIVVNESLGLDPAKINITGAQ